jgi:hypothetical protein
MVALLLTATYPMQMLIVLSVGYLLLIPQSIRRYRAYQSADEAAATPPVDPAAGEDAPLV